MAVRRKRRKARKEERNLLIFGTLVTALVLLFTLGPIIRGSRNTTIDLKNRTTEGPFLADGCQDCKKFTIRDRNDKIIFEESLTPDTNNEFREYLIRKARKGDKPDTTIQLFNNRFSNRVTYVSFDISNSAVRRNEDSIKRGADIKYSDLVFRRFQEFAEEKESLLPRNVIIAKYYGPTFQKNPCNARPVISYIEPEWKASIFYSGIAKQALYELGDKVAPRAGTDSQGFKSNDSEQIYSYLKNFYEEGISNENPGCHSGTYLIPHLTQIKDEISNKNYRNYQYILLTDGEFYLDLPNGEVIYVSPENFDILFNLDYEDLWKPNLCKTEDDKFIIVGMEYGNNSAYREVVQNFYKKFLEPCELMFENL